MASDNSRHGNMKTLRRWHVKENGWDDVAYQYCVWKDGKVEQGRKDSVVGSHAKGFNSDSIGIMLFGHKRFYGVQFVALASLLENLMFVYNLTIDDIQGHNFYNSNKECPCYNVDDFKRTYLIDKEHLKWNKITV